MCAVLKSVHKYSGFHGSRRGRRDQCRVKGGLLSKPPPLMCACFLLQGDGNQRCTSRRPMAPTTWGSRKGQGKEKVCCWKLELNQQSGWTEISYEGLCSPVTEDQTWTGLRWTLHRFSVRLHSKCFETFSLYVKNHQHIVVKTISATERRNVKAEQVSGSPGVGRKLKLSLKYSERIKHHVDF